MEIDVSTTHETWRLIVTGYLLTLFPHWQFKFEMCAHVHIQTFVQLCVLKNVAFMGQDQQKKKMVYSVSGEKIEKHVFDDCWHGTCDFQAKSHCRHIWPKDVLLIQAHNVFFCHSIDESESLTRHKPANVQIKIAITFSCEKLHTVTYSIWTWLLCPDKTWQFILRHPLEYNFLEFWYSKSPFYVS